MQPKLKLVYSRPYNRALNSQTTEEEFSNKYRQLPQLARAFESLVSKNHTTILDSLEHYSDYRWNADTLQVYIVDSPARLSFYDPITIQFHPNPSRMLLVLIHELAHVLVPGIGPGREAALNRLVECIADDMGLSTKDMDWMHSVQTEVHPDYSPISVDLEQKPLKAWEAL